MTRQTQYYSVALFMGGDSVKLSNNGGRKYVDRAWCLCYGTSGCCAYALKSLEELWMCLHGMQDGHEEAMCVPAGTGGGAPRFFS